MSGKTKIEWTGQPAHPDTYYHGEFQGNWWHMSKPPQSVPLEPCACTETESRAGRLLDGRTHDEVPIDPDEVQHLERSATEMLAWCGVNRYDHSVQPHVPSVTCRDCLLAARLANEVPQ